MNADYDTASCGIRRRKNLKKLMAEGYTPKGLYLSLHDPAVVEMAAATGYDFVIFDTEHYLFNPETIQGMIRAADSFGIVPMARVADIEMISPLLDFGLGGFRIPHIRSAAEAKRFVEAVKYAPVGIRGFSDSARAQYYGHIPPFPEHARAANDEIILTVMIEDKEGIDHMDEICATPGIDCVHVGPGDLSQALGHIGEITHPDVLAMEARIYKTAEKYGIKHSKNGGPLVVSYDSKILMEGFRNALAVVK